MEIASGLPQLHAFVQMELPCHQASFIKLPLEIFRTLGYRILILWNINVSLPHLPQDGLMRIWAISGSPKSLIKRPKRRLGVTDHTATLRTLWLYYGRYGRFRPHHSTYDCIMAGADRITPLTTALWPEPTASPHYRPGYRRLPKALEGNYR